MAEKAVVLLSGGLDSSTALYWAKSKGFRCRALVLGYGQRHSREIISARKIARLAGVPLLEMPLRMPWLGQSSLVNSARPLPDMPLSRIGAGGIPSTYVPGRNTIFVALGISLADASDAGAIVVGANALDYSGYPDCRPSYYRAFERVAKLGTRSGSEGRGIQILAPLIRLNKARIVQKAFGLGVPLKWTWSCYRGGNRPCGRCDSCKLRKKGFQEAGLQDPAL
ncbi:MAG: 7-cyano-7-deazaguanine synthase QueC [Elusimicrobia bacterium RIFCSPLOWO2_12_FULL_59_9]|nr:MAG: 7-cyano-7-deazaguanine synthase QueC [Elusimicrobia bacterium RIFCSPLOWO2_12_FULL_59_9]